jgi:hypothetical protein
MLDRLSDGNNHNENDEIKPLLGIETFIPNSFQVIIMDNPTIQTYKV